MSRIVVGTMLVVALLSVALAGVAWAEMISGTNGNDVLVGTPRADKISGLDGKDRIDGGDGPDVLQGNRNDDTLIGGAGDDMLGQGQGEGSSCGGPGDDELKESLFRERGTDELNNKGISVFIFGAGWGQDRIGKPEDSFKDFDTLLFNSSEEARESCAGLVTADLQVDLVAGRATDGTNTVRWSPFTIEIVRSADGDDEIVAGEGGPYTVYSHAGDDTVDISGNGRKSDQVGCGDGIDTVVVDPSDVYRDLGGGVCENVTVRR